MNDFLQTLRSNQTEKQRTPMTRRTYDEAFYNAVPRYQTVNPTAAPYQPSGRHPVQEGELVLLQQALNALNNHMAACDRNQKKLIDAQEKTADLLERQVVAFEKILDHLKISSR